LAAQVYADGTLVEAPVIVDINVLVLDWRRLFHHSTSVSPNWTFMPGYSANPPKPISTLNWITGGIPHAVSLIASIAEDRSADYVFPSHTTPAQCELDFRHVMA